MAEFCDCGSKSAWDFDVSSHAKLHVTLAAHPTMLEGYGRPRRRESTRAHGRKAGAQAPGAASKQAPSHALIVVDAVLISKVKPPGTGQDQAKPGHDPSISELKFNLD